MKTKSLKKHLNTPQFTCAFVFFACFYLIVELGGFWDGLIIVPTYLLYVFSALLIFSAIAFIFLENLRDIKNYKLLKGTYYQKIESVQNKGVEYSVIKPILGSSRSITTTEKSIYDLRDGVVFFTQPDESDKTI